MSEKQQDSVYITGSGKINGGVYDVIKIMGAARVLGDIEANSVNTVGSASFSGSINALNVLTSGSCKVEQNVTAGTYKTAGSSTVEGEVRATQFACSGSQRVGGNLIAGSVRLSGNCRVGKDVEADQFFSKGRFHIGGLLTADEVKIELGHSGGSCRASEIGGERIEVRLGGPFWELRNDDLEHNLGKVGHKLEKGLSRLRDRFGINIELGDIDKMVEELAKFGEKIKAKIDFSFDHPGEPTLLEVDTIEGDLVHLENTKAKVVRGQSVTIGPGCHIERVEYGDSITVDDKAQVGERAKI